MSETPDSGDCVGYNGFSSDVPAVLLAKLVANEIADRRYLPKLSDTEAWDAMWKEIVVPLGHKNCLRNERGVYEDQLAGVSKSYRSKYVESMRGKIESEASVLLRSHSSSKLPIPRISNSKNTSSMTTPGNFLNGEGVVIKPTSGKVTPHSATTTPTPVFVDEANSIKRYLDKLRSHIANTNWCVVENPHTIVLQGVGDVRYVFPRTPETARDILCCCTLQDFSVESFIASLVDSVIPAHILAAGRAITTPPAYTRLPCCVFAIHAIVLL